MMEGILKNKKGITLIELIAVIVILGIIAAITIPTVGSLIRTQREEAAELQYELVLSAAALYANVNVDATTFTLEDIMLAGYLSANPFDIVDEEDITFSAHVDTRVVTNTTAVNLSINGVLVYTAP